ncbi:Nitroreductase, partial [human gut metagenome]
TQLTHFMVITNQVVLKELVTLVQEEYGKMPITENTLPYMVNIIKMSAEGKFIFNYGAPALIVLASQASYDEF